MNQRILQIVQSVRGFGIALARLAARAFLTISAGCLALFLMVEISIPGGFRAVVLPSGDFESERSKRLIDEFHLDDNVLIRFGRWLLDVVRGDFGRSLSGGDRVTDLILPKLSISLQIMLIGVVLTMLIGIPLGLAAAAHDGRKRATIINTFLGLAQSVPVFVTPLFLIWFFAVRLNWLPAAGWVRISDSLSGNLRNLILPMTALVLAEVGTVARIVRADVLRVLQSDFITSAKGKGLSRRYILFRHALRPASLGLLNVVGLNIGALMSGALVLELIFGIGALGRVLLEASISRDLYLLLGIATYAGVIYATLSALVDVLTMILDPRIRRR